MMEGNYHKEKSCNNDCSGLCCTKVENFCVKFGNNEVLDNVNIHIHCGELTSIIGPNGAGKSTFLKALLGEEHHSGSIKFMNSKGTRTGIPIIGYVPQSLNLDKDSPTSVLDLFASCLSKCPAWLYITPRFKEKVNSALKIVKAEHLINRKLGALSGGEMQRVMLALALEPMPDLLLLDEPVSGIDQNGIELFYEIVSNLREMYDLSIILISHDFEMVKKYSDKVVLLNRTVVRSGNTDEVLNSEEFRNLFSNKFLFHSKDNKDRCNNCNSSKCVGGGN